LIGLSGSGKTTVGRLVAARLGWRFVDTDEEIRRKTGQTVQEIFHDRGEPYFRVIEAEVVQEACARVGHTIATGGGAVLDPANRACMLSGNVVVFLESPPEILAQRLETSIRREPRPLLAGGEDGSSLVARLRQLADERRKHYRCAHHVVQTERHTPGEVADVVARLVQSR
jgi:shikimate kinase